MNAGLAEPLDGLKEEEVVVDGGGFGGRVL